MSNFQEELINEDGYENIVIIAIGQSNISAFNSNFTANSVVSFGEIQFISLVTGQIDSYNWDFGDGNTSDEQNPVHIYNDSGFYSVSLTVDGPNGSDTETKNNYIQILEPETVIADFAVSTTSGIAPFTVTFINTSIGTIESYLWDFGDGETSVLLSPVHTYDDPGEYLVTLVVANILGCKDSVSSYVNPINSEENLFIPNSFTPNEDELNKIFKANADTLQDYEIWIYNRWGELIFYSDNIENGWDGSYEGRVCQNGVYAWRIQYFCGEAIQVKIGTVTLIR